MFVLGESRNNEYPHKAVHFSESEAYSTSWVVLNRVHFVASVLHSAGILVSQEVDSRCIAPLILTPHPCGVKIQANLFASC